MSEEIELHGGGYRASIDTVGGAVRALSADGVELIPHWPDEVARPMYAGVLCAPWPNRVADAIYRFRDVTHRLAPTPEEPGHALHGLVTGAPWQIVAAAAYRVRLSTSVADVPGWPFRLGLTVDYAVGPDGMDARLVATNIGADTLPYGCCPHPYLVAPVEHDDAGRNDRWTMSLPAGTALGSDERKLPTGPIDVTGTALDFREGAVVGPTEIDHCFTDLARDSDGWSWARISATAPDVPGLAAEVSWGPWATWLQVFSTDRPGSPVHRKALAIEPMSCPPNAYNSGVDLVELAPGAQHEAQWAIALVET